MAERPNLKLKRKLPFAAQAAGSIGLAFAAMAPTCGGADNKDKTVTPETNPQTKSEEYKFPWADGQTWYLTGGPHFDGLSGSVKYAIDFAPPDVVDCKTGNEVLANWNVTASAAGKVIVSGIDTDRSNQAHSIVVVENNEGKGVGYMHLANIKVKVNETVTQGEILGNPSCEFPPGGKNLGAHVHVFAVDGKDPKPITNITFSGWQVHESSTNYNGSVTKAGEDTRTADTRRCGPDAKIIKACDGLRNDLGNGQNLETAPTMAEVPTVAKPPTLFPKTINTIEPQKTKSPENSLEAGWRQATEKTQKFIDLLLSGTPQDLQAAFDMQMTRAQMDKYPTYYKVAEMDTIQQCSDEMHKGEFALEGLSKYVTNVQPTQTETDRINKQRGLLPPDKFAIGVAFRDRQYSIYLNGRGQFRDYIPTVDGTIVGFMDVGGGNLMISETQLCLKGPLVKVVGQPANR